MSRIYVYLCGGINKLSDAECKDWREAAKEQLTYPYECLDPMRRDYRGMEDRVVELIFDCDLQDIAQSKIILVRAERPSWGTAMEIVYAKIMGKKVVIFGAGDKPSPWLVKHADYIADDLTLAIGWIKLRSGVTL